jgi:hypothetical protein
MNINKTIIRTKNLLLKGGINPIQVYDYSKIAGHGTPGIGVELFYNNTYELIHLEPADREYDMVVANLNLTDEKAGWGLIKLKDSLNF